MRDLARGAGPVLASAHQLHPKRVDIAWCQRKRKGEGAADAGNHADLRGKNVECGHELHHKHFFLSLSENELQCTEVVVGVRMHVVHAGVAAFPTNIMSTRSVPWALNLWLVAAMLEVILYASQAEMMDLLANVTKTVMICAAGTTILASKYRQQNPGG
jgi:hypothetical protein